MQKHLFLVIFLLASKASAFDAAFFRTQSSSSYTNEYQLGLKVLPDHKLIFAYSESKDTTGTVTDDFSNYEKLSYRFRLDENWSFGLDGKIFDGSYNYKGLGGSFRVANKIYNWGEEEDPRYTVLRLRLESQRNTYSKMTGEEIISRSVSFAVDQDFSKQFSAGIEATIYDYSGTGTNSNLALNNGTTSISDIDSYSSYLLKSSQTIFAEYSLDSFVLGISRSNETAKLASGTNYVSTEFYLDLNIFTFYTLSFSLSQGKSVSSPTATQILGFGISGEF